MRYLAQAGLVDLRESRRKVSARVRYDKILLEIAVRGESPLGDGAPN